MKKGIVYVWREGLGVVEKEKAPALDVDAPYVHGDEMDAQVHPGDGRIYESKASFRRATRQLGLTEVGNERVPDRRAEVQKEYREQGRAERIDYMKHRLGMD